MTRDLSEKTPLNLAGDPRTVRAVKRPMPTPVRFAETDGCCETREGNVAYRAGDAILSGVEGEIWPISRSRFDVMYEPAPPLSRGEEGRYVRHPTPVLALQLERPVEVAVGWRRDPLQGAAGDWLVEYSSDDHAIVAASVFSKTYQVL